MNILFVGDLNEFGRSAQRFRVLGELGHRVIGITTVPRAFRPGIDKTNLWNRFLWKLGIPPDATEANKEIRAEVQKGNFDVVWIEKGVTIRPATLIFIKKVSPKTKLAFCSEDDMHARHSRTLFFDHGVRYYDVVFTTKTYNLAEMKLLGARRVELFLDSYDKEMHRPLSLNEKEREKYECEVSAIGAFEKERATSLLYLAEHGIKVVAWGNGWSSWVGRHSNLLVKNEHLFGIEYAKAINATKINLNFLRKINRDEVTSRSVEIPACGGFMLAERTKRHLEFFIEGKEAEFFGSNEEMLEKVRYYLEYDEERKRIAAAGKMRCEKNGYSNRAQLARMLGVLDGIQR